MKVVLRTTEGERLALYQESHALVVGNGAYTKGWDAIPGATRDAADVAAALKNNGFNVILRTDLSKEQFERAFRQFCIDYGQNPQSRILFYYAGHGYTQKMQTDEDLGYLVMVDTPAPETDPREFSIRSVDMVSLVTQAKLIKARHVLFMFDSCFSGSILSLRDRITPKGITESLRYPVRQFITAGRANEPVPDHSKFKTAFLDLIEGRDEEPYPDGYVTGEELGYYLKYKVPEYSPTQHPQYGKIRDPKLDKGDFVFLVRSSPAQPTPDPAPVGPAVERPNLPAAPSGEPTRTTLRITPRVGASTFTGLAGVEVQIDHIAVAAGWFPSRNRILAGLKYYFEPDGHSWQIGVSGGYAAWEEEWGRSMMDADWLHIGVAAGYRWRWNTGANISVALGAGYGGDAYQAQDPTAEDESDRGISPSGEVALGWTF